MSYEKVGLQTSSSVATGGGAQGGTPRPPLPSTDMATGFVQTEIFFFGGGGKGRVGAGLRATSPVCPGIFLHPSRGLTPPTFYVHPRPISVGNPPWESSLGQMPRQHLAFTGRQRLSHSGSA